jgi:hypothetical protein
MSPFGKGGFQIPLSLLQDGSLRMNPFAKGRGLSLWACIFIVRECV